VSCSPISRATVLTGMCFTRVSITPSIIKVKPLPLLAQGTETVLTLPSGVMILGTFAVM